MLIYLKIGNQNHKRELLTGYKVSVALTLIKSSDNLLCNNLHILTAWYILLLKTLLDLLLRVIHIYIYIYVLL